MTSATFTRIATETANTLRPPVISSGKAGVPATNLTGIKCARPSEPSDANELRETYQLGTLYTLLQTFVQDNLDVLTGDTLVIASGNWSGTYPIKVVQKIGFGTDVRKRLVLEGLKR